MECAAGWSWHGTEVREVISRGVTPDPLITLAANSRGLGCPLSISSCCYPFRGTASLSGGATLHPQPLGSLTAALLRGRRRA